MKPFFISVLFTLFFSAAFGQLQNYNTAYLWRGFSHQWTYNHRCNRLGDYVQNNNGVPATVHCSATGTGADSTYYTSYYTSVSTKNAVFQEGTFSVKLEGKLTQLIEKTVSISIPAEAWMKNKGAYITLINGFDMHSLKAADKIQILKIGVEDGQYTALTNQVKFNVNLSLVLNCQSLECPEFNDKLSYEFDIHYLIAGLNKGEAAATQNYFSYSYKWSKTEELENLPVDKILSGSANPAFTNATLGIKSFSLTLDKALWLLQMDNTISPVNYSPDAGNMTATLDFRFKEWREGMKGTEASPGQSKFSFKRNGWAIMDMDVELLQFEDAKITYGQHSDVMFWKGANEASGSEKATNTFSIKTE